MGVGRILNFFIFSVFADFVLVTGTTVHQADFNPDDLSHEHLCLKHLEHAGSVLDCYLGEVSVIAIGRAFKVAMGYARKEAPRTPSWEFRIFVGCCLQKDLATRWTAAELLQHPFIVAGSGGCGNRVHHTIIHLDNMNNMGRGYDVCVNHFIANATGNFPRPNSNALMEIFHKIPLEISPCPEFEDEIIWTLEENGCYTLKSAYRLVKNLPLQELQWSSLIWFLGCIKKYTKRAWMFLRGRLQTKDFLLQRNVSCDYCCVLRDYTWETAAHLMIYCPFSQLVWKLLLQKINLTPIDCDSSIALVEPITLRLNPHHKGLQTLDKLIFSTFVWLIWCERNWSIFRTQTKSARNLVHIIINTIRSRILYLGINLPDDISSYWNAPPSDHHSNVVRAVCPGWRFSIYSAKNTIVGIVWSDICQPMYAAIESSLDYYMGVLQVIQIIPNLVTQICIEAYSDLIQALRCPSKSPWTARFQVRKLVSSIQWVEGI